MRSTQSAAEYHGVSRSATEYAEHSGLQRMMQTTQITRSTMDRHGVLWSVADFVDYVDYTDRIDYADHADDADRPGLILISPDHPGSSGINRIIWIAQSNPEHTGSCRRTADNH